MPITQSTMLRTLSIRDFVIVDAIELEFASGFTVFTGETGAGKSILIDALALALGGRGDASVVREGELKQTSRPSLVRTRKLNLGWQNMSSTRKRAASCCVA